MTSPTGRTHVFKLDEHGNADEFAWESERHGGVVCIVCRDVICVFCEPNYWELECDIPDEPLLEVKDVDKRYA